MMINLKKILILNLLLAGSGCGFSNVSAEWDCPKMQGTKCISIYEADNQDTLVHEKTGLRKIKDEEGNIYTILGKAND